jgi:hypothetical protein
MQFPQYFRFKAQNITPPDIAGLKISVVLRIKKISASESYEKTPNNL